MKRGAKVSRKECGSRDLMAVLAAPLLERKIKEQ
jgi:hypothetical protein